MHTACKKNHPRLLCENQLSDSTNTFQESRFQGSTMRGWLTYWGHSVFTDLWGQKKERRGPVVRFMSSCQHPAQFYPLSCTHRWVFLTLLSSQPALPLQDFLMVQSVHKQQNQVCHVKHKINRRKNEQQCIYISSRPTYCLQNCWPVTCLCKKS